MYFARMSMSPVPERQSSYGPVVMAYVAMAHTVMAYIAMAYVVMAYIVMALCSSSTTSNSRCPAPIRLSRSMPCVPRRAVPWLAVRRCVRGRAVPRHASARARARRQLRRESARGAGFRSVVFFFFFFQADIQTDERWRAPAETNWKARGHI